MTGPDGVGPMISKDPIAALAAWAANAGLSGASEPELINGFCERAVGAGLPIGRAHLFIDTLHPVHEGRLFRWGHDLPEPAIQDYGRTGSPDIPPDNSEMAERWRRSPFFRMLQTGESLLRRRLTEDVDAESGFLAELRAAGMTDYVAIINRFAPEAVIGDMDCVYSSWATAQPDGFSDDQVAALGRVLPPLALAVKAASLARMTTTLMQTYLGRDAAQRVLGGRIIRGITDTIDAVIWFSDLRGFTRITDSAPAQVIPLLNDYADVIVSAVHDHGGDVLKLIGDGTLAIFTAADRAHACEAALAAAVAVRAGVSDLNARRSSDALPVTDMYLGLHVGEVFYGNIGSTERLDFTVIGPAVNETSRIAAMCRSVEQPVLVSAAFAGVDGMRERLISVGRYALRGVAEPQELFTLDPARMR
jgi:adenylate cyclase